MLYSFFLLWPSVDLSLFKVGVLLRRLVILGIAATLCLLYILHCFRRELGSLRMCPQCFDTVG